MRNTKMRLTVRHILGSKKGRFHNQRDVETAFTFSIRQTKTGASLLFEKAYYTFTKAVDSFIQSSGAKYRPELFQSSMISALNSGLSSFA